jgi:DNA-binding transcriptional LysR family regulator
VYLRKIHRQRTVSTVVPHFLVAPFVVQQTDCCFTFSKRVADNVVGPLSLRIHPLPFEAPAFTVHSFWHERSHDDPAHRWLRKMLRDAAAALPELD